MGEIGLPRREFLYDIKFWEARRIIRGYRRRERTMCIMAREQTFWNVKCSMADTKKIQKPSDLWALPWDDDYEELEAPSEDEVKDLQDLMAAINEQSDK